MPAPFRRPLRAGALARWFLGFPGYLWPWNLLYFAIALGAWLALTPSLATMQTLEPGWIGYILARNVVITSVFFGAWHLYFYVVKAQGKAFKYTERPPATDSKLFLFGNQVRDNIFWTLASGVTIWTAYEVLMLWAYANGWLLYVDWETSPVWFVVLLLLIPVFREAHFYVVHRVSHWRPLYDHAHYLHHRNVNVNPWSGMSMHPIEHLLYFSGPLIHLVLPSHPLHVLFHLFHTGLSPAKGHCGFERIVAGERSLVCGNWFHYLHHTHFECNYGSDSVPVLDKIFGSFHDGSPEADARLKEKRLARLRAMRGASPAAGGELEGAA
ncbi:MAG: sterol desaturase family protein [Ectothiorhodospiraceae bacterium]|nr:sterol desaturase family protein [Chromatiales bacterium]MCP5154870.1 sterol desaturase family protein [Ectothiorhodospiraceae bacterium]